MRKYNVLSGEHVQSFLDKGYLIVKDCVDLNFADRWIDQGYQRLGYDRHDPRTPVAHQVR